MVCRLIPSGPFCCAVFLPDSPSRSPRSRRSLGAGRGHGNRAVCLYADPAVHGRSRAAGRGSGRAHRLGQFSWLPARRAGSQPAVFDRQSAALVSGRSFCERRHNSCHGSNEQRVRVSGAAAHRRGSQRVCSGLRLHIGAGPVTPSWAAGVFGVALCRRWLRNCAVRLDDLGTGHWRGRLANPLARLRCNDACPLRCRGQTDSGRPRSAN